MDNTAGGSFGGSLREIAAVRWFVIFRICFNARFYYPVFTILFLDFGLTISQFAILNAVWAVTIVVLEIPSGALADLVGRRKLLIFTGATMVFEVGLLCFAPQGESAWVFPFFLANRIASGAAEAAASGADEALAYDALRQAGMADLWPRVLEVQMRWQSLAFVFAMLTGALVYDPQALQAILGSLSVNVTVSAELALRLPLFLTWIMSFGALWATLQMTEILPDQALSDTPQVVGGQSIGQTLKITLLAGRWILTTPLALMVILAGFVFDGVTRMVATLSSQYYRLIGLPEASFGLIGSLLAILGVFVPRLARHMAENLSPSVNYLVTGTVILCGLTGMVGFVPHWGLAPAIILFSSMYLTGFFLSHYLNHMAPSDQRATILSFKGLALNLAYGGIGLSYAAGVQVLRQNIQTNAPPGVSGLEDLVFQASFAWFPWSFGITALGVFAIGYVVLRRAADPFPKN